MRPTPMLAEIFVLKIEVMLGEVTRLDRNLGRASETERAAECGGPFIHPFTDD